jgi:uncharacterized protein (TIGR04255 family)
MRRHYRNPPIHEALCEFQFIEGPGADVTLPGRVFARIRESYPAKPREQKIVEAEVGDLADASRIRVRQTGSRIQFSTDDGHRIVAVGLTSLSVHALRPYDSWEELEGRFRDVLAVYVDEAQPVAVSRIGVRYIDRIPLEGDPGRVANVLGVSVNPLSGVLADPRALFCKLEHETGPESLITVTLATSQVSGGEGSQLVLALDLDSVWQQRSDPLSVAEAVERMSDLKAIVTDVFEALISEEARSAFGEL